METNNIVSGCKTIPDLLKRRCRESPLATAFFELDHEKCWQPVSWEKFLNNVEKISEFLVLSGVCKGDRVGIMAATSLNWEYAQMSSFSISANVAGIDPGYPPDQLAHVIRFLNLSVLFVQDREMLEKIPIELRKQIKLIILFEGGLRYSFEYSMLAILTSERVFQDTSKSRGVNPQDTAVIVFSSGTTGSPKAISYSHEQILITIGVIVDTFDDLKSDAVLLCWLPLANLFQRIINFSAIGFGASSYILNNPIELMHYVGSVSPHILIGVPKIFEKVHASVIEHTGRQQWAVRCLTKWALSVGLKKYRFEFLNLFFLGLAEKLVLRRIRKIFGTRIRYLVSGSAPMPIWLLEWFEAIDLPVLEAYGVSENVIPIAINRLKERKLGTVGKPLYPNQLNFASDGEILVRGPGVFPGYMESGIVSDQNQPYLNGYWHTGDLGCLDEEGFLLLTGRKTDVFKTAAGKWISPVKIEEYFRHLVYIEQCVVCQLSSQKIVAIVSIDEEKYRFKFGLVGSEEDFLRQAMMEMLQEDIVSMLQKLPVYQRPLGVVVTCNQFTVLGGELTTNMKIRRKKIVEKFTPHLQRLEEDVLELFSSRPIDDKVNFKPIIHIL